MHTYDMVCITHTNTDRHRDTRIDCKILAMFDGLDKFDGFNPRQLKRQRAQLFLRSFRA